jgi:hypothetical protein
MEEKQAKLEGAGNAVIIMDLHRPQAYIIPCVRFMKSLMTFLMDLQNYRTYHKLKYEQFDC